MSKIIIETSIDTFLENYNSYFPLYCVYEGKIYCDYCVKKHKINTDVIFVKKYIPGNGDVVCSGCDFPVIEESDDPTDV